MAITIRNQITEDLARKVAEMTGESIAEAVRIALAERYERLTRPRSGSSLADEINKIADRCAALPRISNMTDDEILGYDEYGAPTH